MNFMGTGVRHSLRLACLMEHILIQSTFFFKVIMGRLRVYQKGVIGEQQLLAGERSFSGSHRLQVGIPFKVEPLPEAPPLLHTLD